MRYEGDIFRPPSEAESLLLQVTIGCSHNRCTFCGMYRDKSFRIRPLNEVMAEIDECARHADLIHKVFLCDGDALILPQDYLESLLGHIAARLPKVRRVSTYGDSTAILRKSDAELKRLAQLGLGLVYEGLESGSAEVLRRVGKRSSPAEMVEAARRLSEAGIRHSVMFLLGLGGVELSHEHAVESGKLLSKIAPAYASALTLTLVPGTPLAAKTASGAFVLPDRFQLLRELRLLIEYTEVESCLFSANHASNYLPIQGRLSRDKGKLLSLIDSVLASKDETLLRPEWARGL